MDSMYCYYKTFNLEPRKQLKNLDREYKFCSFLSKPVLFLVYNFVYVKRHPQVMYTFNKLSVKITHSLQSITGVYHRREIRSCSVRCT